MLGKVCKINKNISFLIKTSFIERELNIQKIEKLMGDDSYMDIVFLALSCLIDEASGLKYPDQRNKERIKKLLQKYYGGNEFNLIDLLFFVNLRACK